MTLIVMSWGSSLHWIYPRYCGAILVHENSRPAGPARRPRQVARAAHFSRPFNKGDVGCQWPHRNHPYSYLQNQESPAPPENPTMMCTSVASCAHQITGLPIREYGRAVICSMDMMKVPEPCLSPALLLLLCAGHSSSSRPCFARYTWPIPPTLPDLLRTPIA